MGRCGHPPVQCVHGMCGMYTVRAACFTSFHFIPLPIRDSGGHKLGQPWALLCDESDGCLTAFTHCTCQAQSYTGSCPSIGGGMYQVQWHKILECVLDVDGLSLVYFQAHFVE